MFEPICRNENNYAFYIKAEDILATGSGFQSCLGAWNAIKNTKTTIKEKLIECVKSACTDNLSVNYPIIIMNTFDDEVEVIEK